VFVALQLQPEALFRMEFGLGEPDEQGRRMLGPRELSYALSFALGDKLENTLDAAAKKGLLNTREGIDAEVARLLDRPLRENPRLLRFFQEYFGYTVAP